MSKLIYEKESFKIIGACMEVHRVLGRGLSEVVYKDALSLEFADNNIPFSREVKFEIEYKGRILPHYYVADFILFEKIVLEAKAIESLTDSHIGQTLNYLAASKLKLGLLVNFGQDSLVPKRVVF
jgi:GxxExxY protein